MHLSSDRLSQKREEGRGECVGNDPRGSSETREKKKREKRERTDLYEEPTEEEKGRGKEGGREEKEKKREGKETEGEREKEQKMAGNAITHIRKRSFANRPRSMTHCSLSVRL